MRRRALLGGAAAALTAPTILPRAAFGQAYPTRPVTLIVPWPAGGGTDIAMRPIAEAASKVLGQQIIVDNKAGAGGTVGPAAMAATARPDGYTISQIPITVFRLPAMQKVSWDPLTDFSYIVHLTGYLFGVVVRKDSPFKTFNDLVDYARANPGKMTYGTPGAGTTLHITMEQVALKAGVKFTHVPFKGAADSLAAVMGGHTMASADSTGWSSLVDAGELRLLCIWTEKRTERFPQAPTLVELGYGIVSDSPFGIAGPKGMDPAVVSKLHDAFKASLDDPTVKATFKKLDWVPRYMDTATYRKFVAEQVAEQKDIIEKIGLARKS